MGSAAGGDGGRRRLSSSWALVGAALLALGAGSHLMGSSLPTASAGVVGGNLPVGASATDPSDITANNSPSLARNPRRAGNLAVANRVDSPRFSCALHVSFDGGATWRGSEIPFPEGEELPARCFAPDVAFGADGTLYLSFVTLAGNGNTPNAAWLATSGDGGATLGRPSFLLGPLAFQVRLAADPTDATRLYLTWVQASTVGLYAFADDDNPVMFSRSLDRGSSWSAPAPVSTPARPHVVAPSLAVGAGGRLHVLYLDLGDDALDYRGGHEGRGGEPYPGEWALVHARSTDGGSTWDETVVDDAVVPTERFIVFLPPSPSLAVDRAGSRVYAAFHDGRLGDPDVWIWVSEDAGASFGPPRRVNDTPRRDGTSQYLPRLAVAAGGRVDVVYYDRRADGRDVMNEVSLQWSTDGARRFGPRVRLTDQAFDSRIGPGAERGLPDLGSRLGLLSSDEEALAVWADTRGGTTASGEQDLARAAVAFSEGSPLRRPLRTAGLLVAAVGGVLAAWALLGAGRRHRAPAAAEEAEGGGAPAAEGVPTGGTAAGREDGAAEKEVAAPEAEDADGAPAQGVPTGTAGGDEDGAPGSARP